MSYDLVVTEKPSAALKIANALADGKPVKKSEGQVPYYLLSHDKKDVVVCCAVGHLFTVAQQEDTKRIYPMFETRWVESADVSKSSAFTKKYSKVIKKLAKNASTFTVATDYDIEGEVIGYNVVRYLCKQKDAARMKFSTLTKDELVKAYNTRQKTLDWGQAHAGVTRHELDWYYGINLSRALTGAIKAAGRYKQLSSGRVQGPALKLLVDKEKEIKAFIPEPYWQIKLDAQIDGHNVEAWHKDDKIFDEEKSKKIFETVNKKDGEVSDVSAKQFKQQPPHPFDLTSLQVECYRVHRMQPKMTLSVAQDLYTSGFISYPRTSSQKLPKELDHKKLITALKKQQDYAELAQMLLARKTLAPNEGKKKDDAHPAVHPTGEVPSGLSEPQKKLYDLIVRRFLATFADAATRETMTITATVEKEDFVAKGTRTVDPAWHVYYGKYAEFEEVTLPEVKKDMAVHNKKTELLAKETKPPKRFTPSSIIKELEKRNLGTKATRATIVDNLYDRGYVKEKSIEATELGIETAEILDKYSPEILDEALTRHFEEEMEDIRQSKSKPEAVLDHAKKELTRILGDFKNKEEEIGKELLESLTKTQDKESRTVACFNCQDGTLMIKRSKFGRFLACDKYPDCKTTVSLPAKGKVQPTGKNCESCDHEMLLVGTGKSQRAVCINPKCKLNEKTEEKVEGEGETCDKCGKGTMVLRKSVYGQFLGCDKYPKCKNAKQIAKKEGEAP